jgi:hypothetical protein
VSQNLLKKSQLINILIWVLNSLPDNFRIVGKLEKKSEFLNMNTKGDKLVDYGYNGIGQATNK